MPSIRYQVIGPLQSGEGSGASLGLRLEPDGSSHSAVFVWVPEQVLADGDKLAALQKETARAKQLVHPNITRVFGLAELGGRLARVVDFTDGETLRTVLKAVKRLPPAFAARVVADAAMGLHYAHLAGNDDGSPLVHGDLRPETLMVGLNGLSRVAGYGALSVAPKELNGKRVIGRRLYCAPEQILSGRNAASPATDVFLLGLMLYECLTGKRPFARRPDLDVAVASEPLPPVYLPSVPDGLNAVLLRATAKKPEDRYPSPFAFREALELAMGEMPSHEVFAAYLINFYPDVVPAHLLRRHQLEVATAQGRSAAVTEPSAEVFRNAAAPAAPDRPEATTTTLPPPPPRALTPRARPRLVPAPPPEVDFEVEVEPARASSSTQWAWIGVAVGVAALGVYFYGLGLGEVPAPPRLEAAEELAAAPAALPAVVATTAPKRPRAPAMPSAPPPVVLASVARTASKPGGATPAAFRGRRFSLRTEPPVEVLISGKSRGRTPLELPLGPGKYKLQLRDDAHAINTFRTLSVDPAGPSSQEYKLGKGSLSLKAPAGSVSVVDGRPLGEGSFTTTLYEGYHHVVVHFRKDRWEEDFRVGVDEKLQMEAYFDPPSEGEHGG